MPTLTTTLGEVFQPAVGSFAVQATDGEAVLERRQTVGAAWVHVLRLQGAANVPNPVAGVQYRLVATAGRPAPVVQVDQSPGAQSAADSTSVVLAAGATVPVIGFAAIPSATFTRPADTTPYASGDLIANSTTAGSVVPVQVTAARVAAGSFLINRVRLSKSGTGVANATFRVHLFNAAPTVANGDNGVLLTSGRAGYIGRVDVDMTGATIFNDGAAATADAGFLVALAAGQNVWALLEARGAYTPVSGESFALTLEIAQN